MSAPQPPERQVDHGEVRRRDAGDVTPAGPKSGPFSLMTGLMYAAVAIAGIWILVTLLT